MKPTLGQTKESIWKQTHDQEWKGKRGYKCSWTKRKILGVKRSDLKNILQLMTSSFFLSCPHVVPNGSSLFISKIIMNYLAQILQLNKISKSNDFFFFCNTFSTKINTIQGLKNLPLWHNDHKMYLNNDDFSLNLILKYHFLILKCMVGDVSLLK